MAELLGQKPQPIRRWRGRLAALGAFAVVLAVPLVLAGRAGYVGGCPDAAAATAFFAKDASQVTADERDVEIRRVLRCVPLVGMTRAQVQARLGEWTAVSTYPEAAKARKGQLLVWSNGDTAGVAVWFTGPRGHAFLAERYDP